MLPAEERPGLKDVPPPLFKGNNATAAGKCVRDDAFKQTVVSAEVRAWLTMHEQAPNPRKKKLLRLGVCLQSASAFEGTLSRTFSFLTVTHVGEFDILSSTIFFFFGWFGDPTHKHIL